MSLKADIYIGLRNFRNYRKGVLSFRTFIGAVLSISFAMLPILVVLEVSSGMIEGITRRYVEVSSFHLQAGTYRDYTEENGPELQSAIEKIPGVIRVIPFIQGEGLVYSRTGRTGIQIRGVDPSLYNMDSGFNKNLQMIEGGFEFGEDRRGILLSRAIAEELGVKTGDPVKLLVSRTSSRGGRPILKPGNYRVSGIFTTGYHELDVFSVYMDRERAARVFGTKGTFSMGIKVDDYLGSLNDIRAEAISLLPDQWYITLWHNQERSLYRNLETTRTMLILIMGIIILVAAVNISSSMLNLVMEKQEQIAVLKSMGASPGNIKLQFLITGFSIGFLGVLIGTSMGLVISVNINFVITFIEEVINRGAVLGHLLLHPFASDFNADISILNPEYYLEDIPIKIPPGETVMIGIFTLLICLLASYFPAKKAAAVLPLNILRHHG